MASLAMLWTTGSVELLALDTVSVNDVALVFEPSLTVTVTVARPEALAAGFTAMVRSAPLPPSTMLAVGSSVVFDEVAVTVSVLLPSSATVKLCCWLAGVALVVARKLKFGG